MTGSYHQKRDLLDFGNQVQRLLVQRIITARNNGRLTEAQMDFIGELIPQAADVQVLLDNFTPRVDVPSALAELEPMVPLMKRRKFEHPSSAVRVQLTGYISRVETAIRYLKVDPR